MLFTAIHRRDTKPVAKRLIERFGSFAEAINAPPERLKEVKGVGDAAIVQLKLVRAAALRLMQGGIMQRPVLTSWTAVLDYCRAAMGFEAREQFRILARTKFKAAFAKCYQLTKTTACVVRLFLGSQMRDRCKPTHLLSPTNMGRAQSQKKSRALRRRLFCSSQSSCVLRYLWPHRLIATTTQTDLPPTLTQKPHSPRSM